MSDIPAVNPTYGFSCVEFFDDNHGYVVQGNALLRTDDGGVTWDVVNNSLQGLYFDRSIAYGTDFNHTFLVGDYADAIRTTDGGQTFEPLPAMNATQPGIFYFRDNLNGYFTSASYLTMNYWRTTDGGNTWTSSSFMPGVKFVEFPVAGSQSGIMIAGNDLYNTSNGGASWTMVGTPLIPNGGYMSAYYSNQFFDLQKGFLLSQYNLIKTINGGMSWTIVADRGGDEIAFLNPNVGYLKNKYPGNDVAATALYKTYDGGHTWEAMSGLAEFEAEGAERLVDISVPNGTTGYALTSKGRLYKFELTLGTKQDEPAKIAWYPNPAKNEIYLEGGDFKSKNYTVYDLTGRTMLHGTIDFQKINISHLNSGYYFLKIGDFQTAKFKKE